MGLWPISLGLGLCKGLDFTHHFILDYSNNRLNWSHFEFKVLISAGSCFFFVALELDWTLLRCLEMICCFCVQVPSFFFFSFGPRSQVRSVTDQLIPSLGPVCLGSKHPVNHPPVILFKQSAYCVRLGCHKPTKAPLGRVKRLAELSVSSVGSWVTRCWG